MATQYPTNIDSLFTLPPVVDQVSPVEAKNVNDLRDAIVVMQTELGTNPSGSAASLKDRLVNIETAITESVSSGWTVDGSKQYTSDFSRIVGVGTDNIQAKLDVAGSIGLISLALEPNATSGRAKIILDQADGLVKISQNGGSYIPLTAQSTLDTSTPQVMKIANIEATSLELSHTGAAIKLQGPAQLMEGASITGNISADSGSISNNLDVGGDLTVTGIINADGGVDTGPTETLVLGSGAAEVHIGAAGRQTTVMGDLFVNGTTFSSETQNLAVSSGFLYLNNGYTGTIDRTGGLAINTKAIAEGSSSVDVTGSYTATTVPTIPGGDIFSSGDFIQISGSDANNGIYEVDSHILRVLTIKTPGHASEFVQNAFIPGPVDGAFINKVNLSVLRFQPSLSAFEASDAANSGLINFNRLLGATSSEVSAINLQSNSFTITGAASGASQMNIATRPTAANKTVNIGTGATGGTTAINVGTGITGAGAIAIGSLASTDIGINGTNVTLSANTGGVILVTKELSIGGTDGVSPATGTLRATNGVGTDIAGADLFVRGGSSTGTGAGGTIRLQVSTAGATGTGVNAPSDRLTVNNSGFTVTQPISQSHTVSIAEQATTSGNTKTVGIGGLGASGSTTTIGLGQNSSGTVNVAISSSGSAGIVDIGNTAATLNLKGAVINLTATSGNIVTLDGTQTLTNKTLAEPKIKALASTGTIALTTTAGLTGAFTLTLPATNDTVVARNTTETLTNKTLNSPIFVTPNLGVATATSINKVVITQPASSATLTIANLKTLTANNNLTFNSTTDPATINFAAGGTVAYVGGKLTQFSSPKTPSSELAGIITEGATGTGKLVLDTAPTTTNSNFLGTFTADLTSATINGPVASSSTINMWSQVSTSGTKTINIGKGQSAGTTAINIGTNIAGGNNTIVIGDSSGPTGGKTSIFGSIGGIDIEGPNTTHTISIGSNSMQTSETRTIDIGTVSGSGTSIINVGLSRSSVSLCGGIIVDRDGAGSKFVRMSTFVRRGSSVFIAAGSTYTTVLQKPYLARLSFTEFKFKISIIYFCSSSSAGNPTVNIDFGALSSGTASVSYVFSTGSTMTAKRNAGFVSNVEENGASSFSSSIQHATYEGTFVLNSGISDFTSDVIEVLVKANSQGITVCENSYMELIGLA